VRDLLFALARDAKVNVDIHPGITGMVTLNAIDQTLPQLLTRISKQVDMRFEMDGPNLSVMPDSPFLKHYKVDYVNMSRNVSSTISTNTQITTGTQSTGSAGASGSGGNTSGNISNTRIENSSKNQFWESLEKNIKDLLRETDKLLPEGSSETIVEESNTQKASGAAALPQGTGPRALQAIASALQINPTPNLSSQAVGNSVVRRNTFREAASVIMNAESGVITVRATQRQHDKIQEFLDRVSNSARRQVLIEATIVEVTLKDGYEQGIDWTALSSGGIVKVLSRQPNGPANLSYDKGNNPTALINLLETFGTTKVLSSPRLSVLNNQTALLKVVENIVYFNVKSEISGTTVAGVTPPKAFTTTPQTVSVGLVLSVTPQVSDNDSVTLNVRPTITSIGAMVPDPNPDLIISNLVPQIRVREIESVMRVNSGNIAILGGLMEDKINYQNQRIPIIGQIPIAGELVNSRNNLSQKSELVIFLRPVVIKDASLEGDYAGMRSLLPGDGFFSPPKEAQPFNNVAPRR
jgi:general secretion pathway protein D